MSTRAASYVRGPRLVEVLGPAGAGKSTLARALPSRDPTVRKGPTIWGLPARCLAAATVTLLPTIVLTTLRGRWLRPAEIGQMIRLGALRRAVERETGLGPGGLLLLDEGPLFGLAWLEVFFGPDRSQGMLRWRRRVLADWAARLGAVVRLEAGDRVLAHRIRNRSQAHGWKNRPDSEIDDLTARYRDAFDRLLADLVEVAGVPVHELRTDVVTRDEAVDWLRDRLAGVRHGH